MTRVTTSERYLFDHIPRTGGMSMKAIFDDLFGPENVSPIVRWQPAEQVMAQMETKTVITGHFWHAPGGLARRRRAYLTMLRRPEDWALSVYYFFRHNDVDEDDAVRRAKTLDLEAFVMSDDPVVLETISNFLVRHFHQLSDDGYATATHGPDVLGRAKAVVEQYDFVGIHEAFGDSLDMMCHRFGWPAIDDIPIVNRARRRQGLEEIAPEIRARLRALNELDRELYEHGARLFAERRRAILRRVIDLGKTAAPAAAPDVAPAGPAAPTEFGDRTVEILHVEVKGASSGSPILRSGEDAVVVVSALARAATDDFTAGISIRDETHRTVFGTNSHHLGEKWGARPGAIYDVEFRMRMPLGEGLYFVTVALHEGPAHFRRCFHWRPDAAVFEIRGRRGGRFEGLVDLSPTVVRRVFAPLRTFGAEIVAERAPTGIPAGASASLPLRVRNTGDEPWLASGPRPVRATYHWLNAAGDVVVYEGRRTPLPADVNGGEEVLLDLTVDAPGGAGGHILRITLVQESVAWFEDHGMEPVDLPITITECERADDHGTRSSVTARRTKG